MDGYALGRELRARLGDATPILIALTGYGQEQDQRRSEEAGFASHLVKPVDARRLIHLVDTLAQKLREESPPRTRPRRNRRQHSAATSGSTAATSGTRSDVTS